MRVARWLCYLLGLVCAFLAGATMVSQAHEADRDYVAAPVVHEHVSPDPQNRFFVLAISSNTDGDINGGVPHIGIITPQESALADWLSAHDGKRVALSLRAGGPLTRDGELPREEQ
jgi:hypothetical protein